MAVTAKGDLYTWGSNTYGQLGHGDNTLRNFPVKVTGISNVDMISTSNRNNAAITDNGDLYTWGLNVNGVLGHGDTVIKTIPTKVTSLSNVRAVSVGGVHMAAITASGELYTWGVNHLGQLGHGDQLNRTTPTKVTGFPDAAAVNLGVYHSAAISNNGDLYFWGNNYYGQLGDGSSNDKFIPEELTSIPRGVYIPGISLKPRVAFSDLTANGSETAKTTVLTLTFDQVISGLTASDITVTNATIGELFGAGPKYALTISNITAADNDHITVTVAKEGYIFTPKSSYRNGKKPVRISTNTRRRKRRRRYRRC